MSEPSEFWIKLLPKRVDIRKPASARHDYCKKVLELLAERHPNLYSGQAGATLSFEEAQSLVDTLQKNTPGHIYKHRICFLIRGLEKGTLELGWIVAIPEAPLVIPRDKPRFTLENFTALPEIYSVESAFLENIKHALPDTYTTRVGQILLSGILFGGLIQKRWLAPWVESLPSAIHGASQLWLNMVLTSEHLGRERRAAGKTGKTKAVHTNSREKWEIPKRWFADPLTHSLILRWLKDFPDDLNAGRNISPLLAIRQYLDLIRGATKKTSESFVNALLHGSATRIGLGVPSYLVAYAEGKNISVSLSPDVWERLETGKIIITPSNNLSEDEKTPESDQLFIPVARNVLPMLRQERMFKEILAIILPPITTCKRKASNSREALKIYYDKNQESMCQALSCLVLWCIDLLTYFNGQELIRGRVKSIIRASSVNTYLHAIGKRLIAVAGNEGILDLESDELHDLYSEVIDSCPNQLSKNRVGTRLYGFHQFLSIKLGAPSVDFSDLGVKSGPVEAGVNANLFSFDSFDQMKKALCPDYSKASRMRKMQLHLAIIAFRCGLREMEALKLRIIDLQGNAEPELFVRTNRYGYVKSSSSTRRIPLACLLEEDELKYLLAWRRDRKLEDVTSISESLLFCQGGQPTVLLPKHEVFPPIVQAIRQVTGDSNLVFHHFRHSFATWMLLRLLKDFSPEIRKRFHFLAHAQFESSKCSKLRKVILGNHMLGRQALFATAQLCGHTGPEVTLLHYFHLCDWLLGIELALPNNQPKLDVRTIKAITGLPEHLLYYDKREYKDMAWHMSLAIKRLIVPEKFKSKSLLQKINTRLIPEKKPSHSDVILHLWQRVSAVIREGQIGRIPLEVLAKRSGFTEKQIDYWISNVVRLSEMRTKQGHFRHINGDALARAAT